MLFCGIDAAKHKHAVILMDGTGQVSQPAVGIANTRQGFDQLGALLQAHPGPVQVGLEATGHYWLGLYAELTRQGYPVVEQIGDGKRKILSILDRVFPEYEALFSSVFLKSSRELLKSAVSAHEIADFDLVELSQLLHSTSRGRFGQPKAEAIRAAAQRSIGVDFLADAVRMEMRCLLDQIDLLQEQVAQIDDLVAELMDQIPPYLTSIPGVGPVTAAAILAEIGDVQRFDGPEKLVAYAGIDATVYQTGQFQASEAHMSKRGSPYLHHALWQAASMTVLYDPELKAYHQAKRQEGKHPNTAVGAVCRKLLVRIYTILIEQRPYVIRDC